MEPLWQFWKQGFESWERATAELLEGCLKSPTLLEPAGAMLTAAMKLKKQADDAVQQAWSLMGLPTRREQERMLHVLNQIQSRLMDLEEWLETRREQAPSAPPASGADPSEAR